jgi:hypothetical protein
MTPEERLLKLELNQANQAQAFDRMSDVVDKLDGKVDQLIAVTNMGKGAWLLILKAGGVLLAIAAALAWIVERFEKFFPLKH